MLVFALAICLNYPELELLYVAMSSWLFVIRLIYKPTQTLSTFKRPTIFRAYGKGSPLPQVSTSVKVIVEDVVKNSLLLVSATYLTTLALQKLSIYRSIEYLDVLSKAVLVTGVTVIVYFTLRTTQGILAMVPTLKGRIARIL
ncbi:MAG: hypothetical protein QXP80_05885 [Zestosphaera sp.]